MSHASNARRVAILARVVCCGGATSLSSGDKAAVSSSHGQKLTRDSHHSRILYRALLLLPFFSSLPLSFPSGLFGMLSPSRRSEAAANRANIASPLGVRFADTNKTPSTAQRLTRGGAANGEVVKAHTPLVPLEVAGREAVHLALRIRGSPLEEVPTDMTPPTTHIYTPNDTDATMHANLVLPLIQSALNGFNSNVVCAGGVQAGKSRTMWGQLGQEEPVDDENQENQNFGAPKAAREDGLIAYALEQTFERVKEASTLNGYSYVVGFSLFAITPNDCLLDCLSNGVALPTGSPTLKLQEDGSSKLQVSYLTKKVVQSKGHALRILASVMAGGEYKKNHMVATITIESHHESIITSAKMQFIDVASALPVVAPDAEDATTHASASRRPTVFNHSLMALEKVVHVLYKEATAPAGAAGAQVNTLTSPQGSPTTTMSSPMPSSSPRHVPFRESKLTRLLKDGLGQQSCRTHTLFIVCMQSSGSGDANKAASRFARKVRCISNQMCDNADASIIQASQSLHQAIEQSQQKVKHRFSMVCGTPMTPSAPRSARQSGRLSTVQGSPQAGPVSASRVRRQLFDSAPHPDDPKPQAKEVESVTEVVASSPVIPPATPKSRRPSIADTSFTLKSPTARDAALVSPNSSRRWKVSSASKPSPSPTTPSSTRRWGIKSRTGAGAPSTPNVATSVAALKASLLAKEKRLDEMLQALESLTAKQNNANQMDTPTRAAAIEDAATNMARESAALAQCEILRMELATLRLQLAEQQQQVQLQQQQSQSDSASLSTDNIEVSICEAPSSTMLDMSESSFLLDDSRSLGDIIPLSDEPGAASDPSVRLGIVTEFSELSVAEEEVEEVEEEATEVLPPPLIDDALLLDGTGLASSSTPNLADLMRRSLGVPKCLRSPGVHTPLASATGMFPSSSAHLNLVNTLLNPDLDNARLLAKEAEQKRQQEEEEEEAEEGEEGQEKELMSRVTFASDAPCTVASVDPTPADMPQLTTPLIGLSSDSDATYGASTSSDVDPSANLNSADLSGPARAARLAALKKKQQEYSVMHKVCCACVVM